MPNISVIIPAYNLERYIAECIKSVQAQSYEDIEIIIVDDGSVDSTFDICREIAGNDRRIKLYRIAHGGAAVARNAGLGHADGSLIFWVDGDDTIRPDTLEILTGLMGQTDADIAKNELTESAAANQDTYVVYRKDDYIRKVLTDEIKSYMAGTLFKKELFDGIKFPEGMMVEDYAIYPDIVNKAKIIVSTNKSLYSYRRNRCGSETYTGRNRICGLWARAFLTMERYEKYRCGYPDESNIILAQSVSYANISYMKMITKKDFGKEKETIREYLEKNIGCINRNRYLTHYKKKVAAWIINRSSIIYPLSLLHGLKGNLQLIIKRRKI